MITKIEARNKIEEYFSRNIINPQETKKIKKLAMAHRIRLGKLRQRFCKKCLSDLREGKARISKANKAVTCKCGFVNKWKI